MTRSERRGLIALLILLAILVGLTVVFGRGCNRNNNGTDGFMELDSIAIDSVSSFNGGKDTVIKSRHSSRRKKLTHKAKARTDTFAERDFLEEHINDNR